MRWERLFADLEALLDADERAVVDAQRVDLVRQERAELSLADRLAGQRGSRLRLMLCDGSMQAGVVEEVGRSWVLLHDPAMLIPLAAIVAIRDAGTQVRNATSAYRAMPLTVMVRALARERARVRLAATGGILIEGTIDVVGRDHCQVAEHPIDELRRQSAVRSTVFVALDALIWVQVY